MHAMLTNRTAFWCWVAALAGGVQAVGAEGPSAVRFETSDGVKLGADYYAPRRSEAPAVLLLHDRSQTRACWDALAADLQRAGFAVLALDLRGHGESATAELAESLARNDPKFFWRMDRDIRAGYTWLAGQKNVDLSRLAIVGDGIAGPLSLRYGLDDRSLDAIVMLQPQTRLAGIDTEAAISKLRGRTCLLVAGEEEKAAAQQLAHAAPQGRVLPAPSRVSGAAMLADQAATRKAMVEFLKDALPPTRDEPVYGSINSDVYHEKGSTHVKRIKADNLRIYSSANEAQARGLRRAKTKGPTRTP